MFKRFVVQRVESDETVPSCRLVCGDGLLDRRVLVFWAVPIDNTPRAPPRRFRVMAVIQAGCAWPADSEVSAIRPGFVFTPPQ